MKKCQAGGELSSWFPPGRLSQGEKSIHYSMKEPYLMIMSKIRFSERLSIMALVEKLDSQCEIITS